MNKQEGYYVGVDIGGTRIKLGVFDKQGRVLCQELVNTSTSGDDIRACIKNYVEKAKQQYSICGTGICTPGVIRKDGVMQTGGAIKAFIGHNLQQEFQEFLQMEVAIESDSKAAGRAEKWIGAAKDCANFVCITLGTAVGGAIFINHELYRGYGGGAGEFGVMLGEYTTNNYNEASFSAHAGVVAGLCRNYSIQKKERVLDAKLIFDRFTQGDQLAQACIHQFYHETAILLVNIAMSIAPETIFIGGGISCNLEAMRGITKAYEKLCNEYHVLSLLDMPTIKTCSLQNTAGMIGAISLLTKA